MFKSMTIGKKIGLGFAVLMILLAGVVVISYGSVARIGDSIPGKILSADLVQKELDHLNWANRVSALLTDDTVTELAVQTDDRKCAFGKWLYGEGRKDAETRVPSIAPMLREIEKYHANLHASAIEIGQHFRRADSALPGLLAAREVDHLVWTEKINALFMSNSPELVLQTDPTECAFGRWLGSEDTRKATTADREYASLIEACKEPHKELHLSAVAIQDTWRQRHDGLIDDLNGHLADHRTWGLRMAEAIINKDDEVGVQVDPGTCAFCRFWASEGAQASLEDFPALLTELTDSRQPHAQLHAAAIAIESAMRAGNVVEAENTYKTQAIPALTLAVRHIGKAIEAEQEVVAAQAHAEEIFDKQTVPALARTRNALHKCAAYATLALEGMNKANAIYVAQTKPNLDMLQELLKKMREEVKASVMTDAAMLATAQVTKRNVTVVGIVAIIAGALLALFISRGIVNTLTRIIVGLNEGANQVNDAVGRVSRGSRRLAEGASEQAASLEETSSALEQMAAMTRTNADNARKANELSDQAKEAAQSGDRTMDRLKSAMAAINESSEQIGKVIKVIEDIAFQTNVLALNAAVEAARAGEHGKGFAVVADEVRDLAQRAASAARETTSLIADSVNRAKEGTEVAGAVGKALATIVGDVTNVTDLIDGITKASEEQAQGVDQINIAVSQMDKVTQQNASGAEDSASSAEELSAQAANVNSMVDRLVQTVSRGNAQTMSRAAVREHRHSSKSTSNCWEVKKCGRELGGKKAGELGVCSAYPDNGRDCWEVAGTLCGGKVQGSAAAKLASCMECDFYQDMRYQTSCERGVACAQ